MRYKEGFKKNLVRKLLLLDAPSVAHLSEETGVSIQTLYKWLRDLKESVEMADYKKTPEELRKSQEKKERKRQEREQARREVEQLSLMYGVYHEKIQVPGVTKEQAKQWIDNYYKTRRAH